MNNIKEGYTITLAITITKRVYVPIPDEDHAIDVALDTFTIEDSDWDKNDVECIRTDVEYI